MFEIYVHTATWEGKTMNDRKQKKKQHHRHKQPDEKAPNVLISSGMLKLLVSAYLLWVVKEIVTGIVQGNTGGASPILLVVACTGLSGGVIWMLVPEIIRLRKEYRSKKQRESGGLHAK